MKCEAQRLKTRVVGCNDTEGWKKNYQANFNKCRRNKFDAAGEFLERGGGERGNVTKAQQLVRPRPFYVPHSATEGKWEKVI